MVGRAVATLAVAVGAVLTLAGGLGVVTARPPVAAVGVVPPVSGAAATWARGPLGRSGPASVPGATLTRRHRVPGAGTGAVPVRLLLPSLHVSASIIPEGAAPHGALDLPADPRSVGWWAGGAMPGAPAGTVVLAGHVDTITTLGALFEARLLPIGAPVLVQTSNGTARYAVAGRRVYRKSSLPAALFDSTGNPRLVLVTCTGTFNPTTRHYSDNLVVYAVPAT